MNVFVCGVCEYVCGICVSLCGVSFVFVDVCVYICVGYEVCLCGVYVVCVSCV